MPPQRKSTVTALAERRAKALSLAVRKVPYEEIARISREENWDPKPYNNRQAVSADVHKAYEQATAERNKLAGQMLTMQIETLKEAEREAWKVLARKHYVVNQGVIVRMGVPLEEGKRQGWYSPEGLRDDIMYDAEGNFRVPLEDDKPVLEALDRIIKIQQEISKLTGTYAPVKKEVQVSAGGNINERITALMANLVTGGQGPAGEGAEAPDQRPGS